MDAASGIHARHSAYYIRSVRADNKDPLTQFMKENGIPNEPLQGKPDQTTVFYFPIKSPNGARFRGDFTGIEQLDFWKKVQEEWCEHKPSITVNVKESEWPSVGGWVYDNFDIISGVSFLPDSDHVYQQAPYQECSESVYESLLSKMPKAIDWKELSFYEKEDHTAGTSTFACGPGDSCEVVDIQS